MKKYTYSSLFIITSVIIASLTIQSCKKGKNDPFLSLRSRDGRLCRAWKLTSITGNSANNKITYDGSTVTDAGTTLWVSATFQITFNKDASVNFVEIKTNNSTGAEAPTITDKNFWTWLNSEKSKEFLSLPISVNPFGLIPSTALNGVFYVDCLKASKLVLVCDDENGLATTNLTFTFTAQ